MYKGWILLYLRDVVDDPFGSPVAHTNCLQLFDTFAESRIRRHRNVDNVPLHLPELVRALELRRAFNNDYCRCSIRNRMEPCVRMTLWEHFFVGAQVAWGPSDWEGSAGDEICSADPMEVSGLTAFARCHTEALRLNDDEAGILSLNYSTNGLLNLPSEPFQMICERFPLRGAPAVRNSCCRTRELLRDTSPFWKKKAIGMHGDWFWELEDTEMFPAKKTNWMKVLWQIEVSRAEVFSRAGFSRNERERIYLERRQLCKEGFNPSDGALPLGLKNRLRIWCCLESFGKDGTQITISG